MDKEFKAAIVYPSYAAFNLYGGFEGTWVHHGISSIIAYLEKKGQRIDLIDLRRLKSWADFADKMKDYNLVGYSILSQDLDTALKAIEINKRINPTVKICVGGVQVSLKKEDFLANREVDFIITGEGEIAFYNLIIALKSQKEVSRAIEGEKVILDELPNINRKNWDREKPAGFTLLVEPFFTLISSRSCLYNCRFCQPCSRIVFGDKERTRSPRHVIQEILELKVKYGMKSFFLVDDNVFQNRKWLLEFIRLYQENSIEAKFVLSGRSNNICANKDLLPLLKQNGLAYVIVGFESGSQKILNYLRKGTTVEQNYQAAELLHKEGIKIYADIMFGFTIETRKDIQLTAKMVLAIKPEIFGPTTFTPYPGNDLSKEYFDKKIVLPTMGNPIRHPNRPKIKNVKYLYINFTLMKLQFRLAKGLVKKLRAIIKYSLIECRIIKDYFLNYFLSRQV